MLDQGLDFNSALKVLSSTPLIAPLYYIMGGPNNLQVFYIQYFYIITSYALSESPGIL